MPVITTCVHGNAFYSEQRVAPDAFDLDKRPILGNLVVDPGSPHGGGRSFSVGGWYHVPIPVVTGYDGQPMFLEEVLILLDASRMTFTSASMWIAGRSVWTGGPSVSNYSNLLFRPRDGEGRRIHMNSGFGVSLHFASAEGGVVTFHSASATLQTSR